MVKVYRAQTGFEGMGGPPKFVYVIGVVVILVAIVLVRSTTVVPAGHVKVQDVFGKVNPKELPAGLHFMVHPLAKRVAIDIRTKEAKEKISVPTKEGLIAGLDVSILYHVQPDKADEIYKSIGPNFEGIIIKPVLRNVVRDVIAEYLSEDLYSANRKQIGEDIKARLHETYSERGLALESVLLRDLQLPAQVTAAIERKIKSKQEAAQMEFVLQKEEAEAKRRKIEAEGIAGAQKVISQSLTAEYLQWRYIKTMEQLAGSRNTTFMITPFDQKIVPMLPLEGKSGGR